MDRKTEETFDMLTQALTANKPDVLEGSVMNYTEPPDIAEPGFGDSPLGFTPLGDTDVYQSAIESLLGGKFGESLLSLALLAPFMGGLKEVGPRKAIQEGLEMARPTRAGSFRTVTAIPSMTDDAVKISISPEGRALTTLKRLEPGLVGEPDYYYHATNAERAQDIAHEGLKTHLPWEYTEQGSWPDGAINKRAYFGEKADLSHFAPEEGMPVILRVKKKGGQFKTERYTGDIFSESPIAAENIEILTENGWLPIKKAMNLINE